MRVGVGIFSGSCEDRLRGCLDSLFENLPWPVDVAVALSDRNLAQTAAAHPSVWIVETPSENRARARNSIQTLFASHDVVFLVDDHVRFLRPEWLEMHLRGLGAVSRLIFRDPYVPTGFIHSASMRGGRRVIRGGTSLLQCNDEQNPAFEALRQNDSTEIEHFQESYALERGSELLRVLPGRHEQASRQEDSDYPGTLKVLKEGQPFVTVNYTFPNIEQLLGRHGWTHTNRLPVLAYHALQDVPGDRYAVPPRLFQEQLQSLRRHFAFITVREAYQCWRDRGRLPPDTLLLTFDDGYCDLLEMGPLFEELGIRVTVFVTAGYLGQDNSWDRAAFHRRQHLDADGLRRLAAWGHEIGNHGLHHYRLTALTSAEVRRELRESQELLQQIVGQPVRSVAYPFGGADETVSRLAAETHDVGFVYTGGGDLDWTGDRFRLRRIRGEAALDIESLCQSISAYMTESPTKAMG